MAVLSPWAEEGDFLDKLIAERRMRRGRSGLLAVSPLRREVSRAGSEALVYDERLMEAMQATGMPVAAPR